jgi:hypothetical protein
LLAAVSVRCLEASAGGLRCLATDACETYLGGIGDRIFAEVRVSTLLFYGDDDTWAPVDASIEAWRRARGDRTEIVVLEDTNPHASTSGS